MPPLRGTGAGGTHRVVQPLRCGSACAVRMAAHTGTVGSASGRGHPVMGTVPRRRAQLRPLSSSAATRQRQAVSPGRIAASRLSPFLLPKAPIPLGDKAPRGHSWVLQMPSHNKSSIKCR